MPTPPDPKRRPKQVVNLELDSVALTGSPSNTAADIFLVRTKEGGQMPESSEVIELQRRLATMEAESQAKDARVVELERFKLQAEREKEEALCASIVRTNAPKVAVKDVDLGSLLYRARIAGKAAGDDKLEMDLLSVFRAANAATEAAGALTRSIGTSETDGPEGLSPEVDRLLKPFLEQAKGNIARAHALCVQDIMRRNESGDRSAAADYTTISRFNPRS